MQWRSEFETGHPRIDAEHREFWRQLGGIEEAILNGEEQDQIRQLMGTLQNYVTGHFAHEEAHMLRLGCSAYEVNCRAHHEFMRKLATWIEHLRAYPASPSFAAEIHREAVAWIEAHVLKIDCQLRACAPE